MQNNVSTNLHIPSDLWKELKITAAREGKTMRDIVLHGIRLALGKKPASKSEHSARDLLLKFSGKASSKLSDASVNHDQYIYD